MKRNAFGTEQLEFQTNSRRNFDFFVKNQKNPGIIGFSLKQPLEYQQVSIGIYSFMKFNIIPLRIQNCKSILEAGRVECSAINFGEFIESEFAFHGHRQLHTPPVRCCIEQASCNPITINLPFQPPDDLTVLMTVNGSKYEYQDVTFNPLSGNFIVYLRAFQKTLT